MRKPVNPLLAAIIILAAVAVALFVMYQKSQLPPPIVGEQIRQTRQPQYEDQESRLGAETQETSEAEPAAPEMPPAEDAE